MIQSNTFPKAEHLCGEIRIAKLFAEGKAFIAYPLRVVYTVSEIATNPPVKVLIAVPKKRFKHAVDRNRIKRLMREAYRLNKHALVEKCIGKNISVQIAFNYVADTELEFAQIQTKMQIALQRIIDKIEI